MPKHYEIHCDGKLNYLYKKILKCSRQKQEIGLQGLVSKDLNSWNRILQRLVSNETGQNCLVRKIAISLLYTIVIRRMSPHA